MLSPSTYRLTRTTASLPQTSSVLHSPMNNDLLKLEAQSVLDELKNEGLLAFALEARILTSEDSQHTIYFHDSRFRSVTVSYMAGQCFKDIVRAAVLDNVPKYH